jgi:hypothetical protein
LSIEALVIAVAAAGYAFVTRSKQRAGAERPAEDQASV